MRRSETGPGLWEAGGVLIGLMRPRDPQSLSVEGDSLAQVRDRVDALTPAGYQATSMPVRMTNGTINLTATATIERRDGLEEISDDNMPALRAKIPDGWQLLSVRRA